MEYHHKMTLIGCSCLIVGLVLAFFLSCGEHNPVKPHLSHPSHPVIPSEFIICNLEEDKCQTL